MAINILVHPFMLERIDALCADTGLSRGAVLEICLLRVTGLESGEGEPISNGLDQRLRSKTKEEAEAGRKAYDQMMERVRNGESA